MNESTKLIYQSDECMRCGAEAPTTHMHESDSGSYTAHDCAFAGRADEPGACSGLDLCDDCIIEVEE